MAPKPPVIVLAAPFDGHTASYVTRALEAHGCVVKAFPYREIAAMSSLQDMNDSLLRFVSGADLLLVLKGEYVHPKVIEAINRMGVKTAIWNFDPRDGKLEWVLERARVAQHFFTIGKGLLPYYTNGGINAHWLLEGCDAFNHQPLQQKEVVPISFIGTVSDVPGREEWLNSIRTKFGDERFAIWGSFCPPSLKSVHRGRANGDAGFCQAVSNTQVNLGADRDPEIERSYGARLFRTLAAGGYLLTNMTHGIVEDFSGAVDTYVNTSDCLNKIDWALSHPDERNVIAQRGRDLVLEKHTFNNRVKELLEVTGVDVPDKS